MTSFRIRPRFKQVFEMPAETIEEKIKLRLKTHDSPCFGTVMQGFIVLKILPKDQHYWSPQLSLTLEPDEASEGTLVRGLYGPNPTVWAMFAFGYAALLIMAMFVAIIGFSKMSLNQDASILWLLILFAGGLIALYLIAQVGQKIGVEQTFTLHHFFEDAIGTKIHIT